jgi:hypothetical protein
MKIRKRWFALLATGAALAAGLVAVPAGAAKAAAPACDPVYFIGARGSGEPASGDDGMGAAVGYLASVVGRDLTATGLKVADKGVDYPAVSVNVLEPDAATANLLQDGSQAAGAAQWVSTSLDPFDASMDQGIKATEADVTAVVSQCPDARIVLGGYSQGAVAVHDAEVSLAADDPSAFSHVAGTLLLADPDGVPDSKAKRFGTAPASAQGIRSYLCTNMYVCLVATRDVPDPAATASTVNAGDLVGDFRLTDLDPDGFTAAAEIHTSYTGEAGLRLLATAATWVAAQVADRG